jgi:hypothetical protein
MPELRPSRGLLTAILPAILGLALWLRLTGIDFGLPYLHHPDEPNKVQAAVNIVKSGNLNPHYFKKPTLLIYANAALTVPYYLLGKAEGRFHSRADLTVPDRPLLGTGYTEEPGLMLWGRTLSAVIGVLVVLLTWAVGKRFFANPWVPLLGALAVAVSPMQVTQSHYIEVNIYLVAAVLLVLWASLKVLERGSGRDYLMAGFLVGIAVTCKYPGAVAIIFPATAHWLRSGRRFPIDGHLKLLAIMVPVGFLLGTPYALLDPVNFVKGAGYEAGHYATGHEGLEGNTLFWYLSYAWNEEGPLMAAAAVAIFLAIRRKDPRLTLLASFPLVYFVFISLFQVRNGRTFLPLTPFAFLLGIGLLVELGGRARQLASGAGRWAGQGAVGLALLAGLAVPFGNALEFNRALVATDSRDTSRAWIEANLPEGTAIALESYSPYLRPEKYRLTYILRAALEPPEWYRAQRVEYVIFSEGMYGRYLREPERYPERYAAYQALWQAFPEVRRWTDGAFTIRLHRVQ